MPVMLSALRAALVEAGASEEKADRAAEELVGYENRFAAVESSLSVLKWMVGMNLALSLGLL